MERIVILKTNRSEYDIRDAAKYSITVAELIRELENHDEDARVVFSNDNGYTYGYVCESDVDVVETESHEEEERREKMEELNDELCDLNCDYEHEPDPDDEDDEAMTEEEYLSQRASIFESYGITEEEYNKYFGK